MPGDQKEANGSLSRFGAWFSGREKESREERRRSKRLAAHRRLTLRWRDSLGEDHELIAHLLDASDDGLAVVGGRAIRIGQTVAIEGLAGFSGGVVRHSNHEYEEFVLGLERTADASPPEAMD